MCSAGKTFCLLSSIALDENAIDAFQVSHFDNCYVERAHFTSFAFDMLKASLRT